MARSHRGGVKKSRGRSFHRRLERKYTDGLLEGYLRGKQVGIQEERLSGARAILKERLSIAPYHHKVKKVEEVCGKRRIIESGLALYGNSLEECAIRSLRADLGRFIAERATLTKDAEGITLTAYLADLENVDTVDARVVLYAPNGDGTYAPPRGKE
jgi:hypothetical protein